MGIGAIELLFVVVVGTVFAGLACKTKHRWIAVLPLFFLIAAAASPADLLSTLWIGVPNAVLFVVAWVWLPRERVSASGT